METRKYFSVILMLFFVLNSNLFTYAQDDISCAGYALTAVLQNIENITKNCGFTGERWHSDYNRHFEWCMRVSKDISQSETFARANALKQCGADPKCKIIMRVNVRLKNIYVIDEADGSGNAEPYLWSVFFKLDNETITQQYDPNPGWIHIPYGGHGNLGSNSGNWWNAGDIIPIPTAFGEWHLDLYPIEQEPFTDINNNGKYDVNEPFQDLDFNHKWNKNPDIKEVKFALSVFVMAILLEEDAAPTSASIRGEYHPMFRDNVKNKIQKTIVDIPIFWHLVHQGVLNSFKNEIQSYFKSGFSEPGFLYIFPLIPGAVDIDDVIGVEIWRWSWFDLEEKPFQQFETLWNGSTGSEDGDFKLVGEIQGKKMCQYKDNFLRIRNRWKSDQYVHIEQGKIASSSIKMDWLSAQWTLVPVKGTPFYRLRNRWKNDQYIHIENGKLESGSIKTQWYSAQWSLEDVMGTSFFRLRNRWKNDQCIHLEHGKVESSPIKMEWHSAQWILESVN